MIGEATYVACRHKQQLLPSTKQELPAWIYVRGKVQFESMCCLQGIECVRPIKEIGNNKTNGKQTSSSTIWLNFIFLQIKQLI